MPSESSPEKFSARAHVLSEANYAQLKVLAPNVAVLPWGATEAHNFHLPFGTDNIQATALGEAAVARANACKRRSNNGSRAHLVKSMWKRAN